MTPSSPVIYPNSTFIINVQASTSAGTVPNLISVDVPSGITLSSTLPLSIPSGGVPVSFQTSSAIPAGNYTLTFKAQAGSLAASSSLQAVLKTTPPAFYFITPLGRELNVNAGSSASVKFDTGVNGGPGESVDYSVSLAVNGLPPGATATISPQIILPGQSTTITISAAGTAQPAQNVPVTLTGTPSAAVSPASIGLALSISAASGFVPNNRTEYVSTQATPYAAVYDPAHHLIFASNNTWNRVEVISTDSRAIVAQIPLPEPRGIDITQDDSKVWVGTGSNQVYSIDTSTFAVQRYMLPPSYLYVSYWEDYQLFVLSDGTLMLTTINAYNAGAFDELVLWNPATNVFSSLTPPSRVFGDFVSRTGDAKRVYFLASSSDGSAFYYDVSTKTFSRVVALGEYALGAAVNQDGTRFYACMLDNGASMYDGDFNRIGPLPACTLGGVFSADNRYFYQEALANVPVIVKMDASTLDILSLAPAMPMIPVGAVLSPPYLVPNPFAEGGTGLLYGIQDWGIAFDDSTYAQNYSGLLVGTPTYLQHMDPYFGPLSGGTNSSGFGNAFTITPTVWYGANRGTASLGSSGLLSIISPPSTTPGPVDVKFLFPNGIEVYDPLFFSYGSYLQHALVSGASPQGNVPGQVVGYGLPGDDGLAGTLSVGGANAALQSPSSGNGLPFAGMPYPNKVLGYTVPPGSPGWADISVSTTVGNSTLPKSFWYAKSVDDYTSSDQFTAVLSDDSRQQLYLSAGDHIDVFSLATNQFESPLTPPAIGSAKLFEGLALTPDGSRLLATDSLDGSLAVMDLSNPPNSYAVAVAPVTASGSSCTVGPLYVAPIGNSQAMVVTGAAPPCYPGGSLYIVDLSTHAVIQPGWSNNCVWLTSPGVAAFLESDADGGKLAIGAEGGALCIYDAVAQTYSLNNEGNTYHSSGATISGDGQAAASQYVLTDGSANAIGRVSRPAIYYAALDNHVPPISYLLQPQLNDSGSLYFMPYPNFVDIFDFHTGLLRMRFSLSQTISNVAAPLAIDSGGRHIYLITDKGLTVIDLGQALLSIGWINPAVASAGALVTVRGSGFTLSTTATVGGQAAGVSVVDENTLSLTLPAGLNPGPAKIVLTNPDGKTYTAVGMLTIQ